MEKPHANPEYDLQMKVFKKAFAWHQKITIGHHPSTLQERWDAFYKYKEEFDKLSKMDEFKECEDCPNNHECSKCLDLFLGIKRSK